MASQLNRIITARERAEQALKLRKAGLTYREIAEQLQFSKSAACKAVNKALDELDTRLIEETRLLRALEMDRLDTLQRSLWNDALKGNPQSVDKILKIMERRARLSGLDAPVKTAQTDPTGEESRDGIYLLPADMSPEDWLKKYGRNQDA